MSIRNRRGAVLVVVLVVVALLSLSGYTFCELMLTEYQAADLHGRQLQARMLCDSGLEMTQRFLAQDPQMLANAGGTFDNSTRFRGVMVLDGAMPAERGRFTIVAPTIEGSDGPAQGIRYGLEDESTRLNLNLLLVADKQQPGAGRTLLMGLPGMTEEIADAILDWMDSDDSPREFGAEIDDYAGMVPPYRPKNAQLESVEELLLVRGVTPWLLFGADANRNGTLEPNEQAQAAVGGVDNSTGDMTRGWSGYLTLYSAESNKQADGSPRININGDDLEALNDQLSQVLSEEWTTFIIAYRQNGPYTGDAKSTPSNGGRALDLSQKAKAQFSTVLDLIGAKVQVKFQGESQNTVIESPIADDPASIASSLPTVIDYITVNTSTAIPGRININQAPKAVLLGIPGMTEEIVEQIVSTRQPDPTASDAQNRRHETWLLSEGLVTLDQMKQMMPYVTGQGGVYRVQVVGYYEQGGPAARIEALIDTTGDAPEQLFWRDISQLGRGYSLAALGLSAE